MTAEQSEQEAYDRGKQDRTQGLPPTFNGPWVLFRAYHQGYEAGNKTQNQAKDQTHAHQPPNPNDVRL